MVVSVSMLRGKPFYFLRHGQTDWNKAGLCVGQSDQPLNGLGIEQARSAALSVASLEIGTIHHSTLSRAAQTASIIAEHVGVSLVPQTELREVCFGVKEGGPESNPADDFISAWLRGETIEGAETLHAFDERIIMTANGILSEPHERPPLIVAHWGVFIALTKACGISATDIEHCHPYRFQPLENKWLVASCDPKSGR